MGINESSLFVLELTNSMVAICLWYLMICWCRSLLGGSRVQCFDAFSSHSHESISPSCFLFLVPWTYANADSAQIYVVLMIICFFQFNMVKSETITTVWSNIEQFFQVSKQPRKYFYGFVILTTPLLRESYRTTFLILAYYNVGQQTEQYLQWNHFVNFPNTYWSSNMRLLLLIISLVPLTARLSALVVSQYQSRPDDRPKLRLKHDRRSRELTQFSSDPWRWQPGKDKVVITYDLSDATNSHFAEIIAGAAGDALNKIFRHAHISVADVNQVIRWKKVYQRSVTHFDIQRFSTVRFLSICIVFACF